MTTVLRALGLLGASLAVAACRFWDAELPHAAEPAGLAAARAEEIPRIDLARLSSSGRPAATSHRDLFSYGEAAPRADGHGPAPTPSEPPAPPSAAPPADTGVALAAAAAASFNVKYIGSVENKRGLRVAIFLTDKKEILTGQTGELVANRIRIVKIGLESVDIQDVGSDRVRRVPLKGN